MNWINHLLNEAIQKEASDIHIEHNSLHFSIKFRLKGQLHAVPTPKKHIAPYILNHIKQLAHLDISECYLPQDGRFTYPYYERQIYFRVALIPVYEGESLVLRILNAQQLKRRLNDLNILPQDTEQLRHLIRQPHGLILITGPTGSGKTTTAYALIHEILTPEIKLITVEDPIEYDVPGSIQIPVNEPYGLSFDVILQATLRHDLDVLFVGEIRNQKTAHMALQAALTGHKVIATLHAVDDLGAIPRLSELGIPHYLLKDNLQAIINQQLIADPCTDCNKNGCPTCDYQGIVKRTLHMKIHTPPF
jgi:type II secretory ATPase GspE/PulE/Tfp pilus assembly ATPase PilB-like protein